VARGAVLGAAEPQVPEAVREGAGEAVGGAGGVGGGGRGGRPSLKPGLLTSLRARVRKGGVVSCSGL